MTADQIEATYSAKWGTKARLVNYRLAGNLTGYAVIDGNGNAAPVTGTWRRGQEAMEFETNECASDCAHCDDLMACAECAGCAVKIND